MVPIIQEMAQESHSSQGYGENVVLIRYRHLTVEGERGIEVSFQTVAE